MHRVRNSKTGFLVFIIGAMMLAGCTNTEETTADGRMQLEYWVFLSGGDLEYMEDIVDDYNNSQDEVYVNTVLQDWDEYYTKIVTSVAAERGPDVGISHAASIPELVNQGLLQPVEEITSEAGLDFNHFPENIREAVEVEGDSYAVPIDTHPFILYINTDLAEEAGLLDEEGHPMIEETPEGLKEFFVKAKEENPDVTPLSISTGGVDAYRWWWTVYFQMGGTPIFSDDLREPEITLDREIAIEAAEYIHDFYGDVIPMHIGDFYETFQAGNAVGLMTGVWATGIWEETEGLNFTALPLPQSFEVDAAQGDSHSLIMPIKEEQSQERREAIAEFMAFVSDAGAEWAKAGHIPARSDIVDSPEFQEQPFRSDYAEAAENVVFTDKTIFQNPAETDMVRALDEIMSNRLTPEEGIDEMINALSVTTRQ
ncbi:extracellular solute-binding protein [Shouchella shacheensis]|uniref:extracellular solute-binding protein n=1 Tax=Shouchella shacheensis TaxID=1649580 RepID=UPI00073FF85C|nr:extracellular solute-binding protein [Shouchella shacheensis]